MLRKRRLTLWDCMVWTAFIALELACLFSPLRGGDWHLAPTHIVGLAGALVLPWTMIVLYAPARHEPWLLIALGVFFLGGLGLSVLLTIPPLPDGARF